MTIDDYFYEIEKTISDFNIVVRQKTEKRKIDNNFGIFKGLLYFESGSLDFIEVVRINHNETIKIKYKYHFMSNENIMIFRYDNVPHHQGISTFPNHKHITDEIISCSEPNFLTVLSEIKRNQNIE
ncbi:MAG: hypothetical protein HN704_04735 [Bacteroidetes bacterium]|jgi:hypothetical protein|nr:hypothetical protein [Bacteroidota bacterium]MBT6685842.1 hypothetical protein [Bacteroidota bacterium]MBT7144653.1 hypothetical protein [Bacteroidota bacterium]MBT7490897.1 hypothetical protein [Bacteroidota bacterium]